MSGELSTPRWAALGTLPAVSAVLVGLNALYMILVVVGNITDFDVNQQFVHHVLAMDTINLGQAPGTGLDPRVTWRALGATTLQDAVYIGIIIWELGSRSRARKRAGDVVRRPRALPRICTSLFDHRTVDGCAAVLRRLHRHWRRVVSDVAVNGMERARHRVPQRRARTATLVLIRLPSSSATVAVAHRDHSV
jgi:Predicted small integral membrane protein (DUF2165)